MQMLSNAGQDEAAKVRESVLPYMPDGKIPSEKSQHLRKEHSLTWMTANPAEYTDHNFKYDVFAACEAEMSKINSKL